MPQALCALCYSASIPRIREEHMQDYRSVAVAAAQQAGKNIAEACGAPDRVDYKKGAIPNMGTHGGPRARPDIVGIPTPPLPAPPSLPAEGRESPAASS